MFAQAQEPIVDLTPNQRAQGDPARTFPLHLFVLYVHFVHIVPVPTEGGDMAGEKISAAKAREEFSDLVSRAAYAKERHVVTRRGKAVAAMVPIEDLELLEELEDRIDVIEGLQALADAQEQGTRRWEEVRAELGL